MFISLIFLQIWESLLETQISSFLVFRAIDEEYNVIHILQAIVLTSAM